MMEPTNADGMTPEDRARFESREAVRAMLEKRKAHLTPLLAK